MVAAQNLLEQYWRKTEHVGGTGLSTLPQVRTLAVHFNADGLPLPMSNLQNALT